MAPGATSDFEQTRDEIIRDALANVGAVGPDKTPTGSQLAHAQRALNRVVKSIDPAGETLWRIVRRTTTTTATVDYFDLATDVLSIDEPMSYLYAAGGRQTLEPWSRDEYMRCPDRTVAGVPTRFYVEKTSITGKRVYLWPVPDATADTIEYAAVLRSFDFDTGADTPDFPAEWTDCLVNGLSAALAPVYLQPGLMQVFDAKFNAHLGALMQAETEHGNVVFVPFGRG